MRYKFLIIVGLLIFTSYSLLLTAQCPKGIINCKGQCNNFLDENKDNYCDFTLIKEIITLQLNDGIKKKDTNLEKTKISDSLKNISKRKTKIDKNTKLINKPIETDSVYVKDVKNITSDFDTSANISSYRSKKTETPQKKYNSYDFELVSSLTIGLYVFTFLLSRFRIIKTKTHRKIWNILLLLTFIVSCLFGFFLVLQINYKFLFSIFRTLLYWHVEIGISMSLIATFHIFWHLRYFKTMFKNLKTDENE